MISYPISFSAKAESPSGINAQWSITSDQHQLTCAIPPEFEGPGGGLSPEDLYAQALTNCFVATFKVFAEKSNVTFRDLKANSTLIVDLDENKRPVMKKFILHVDIKGSSNADRVKMLAERAFKNGFILNSVKTELSLELNVA